MSHDDAAVSYEAVYPSIVARIASACVYMSSSSLIACFSSFLSASNKLKYFCAVLNLNRHIGFLLLLSKSIAQYVFESLIDILDGDTDLLAIAFTMR